MENNTAIKLNLGAGKSWRVQGWTNIDKLDHGGNTNHVCDFSAGDYYLPVTDSSVDMIFTSHVIEHLATRDVIRLLGKCLSAMKSGAVIRILCPDYDVFKKAFIEKARESFFWNKDVLAEIALEGDSCAARFISSIARYRDGEYVGPPKISQTYVTENLKTLEDEKFIKWVLGRLPKKPRQDLEIDHRNAFNGARLSKILGECGYKKIRRVSAGESMIEEMESPEFSNRPLTSLIMEAAK